MSSTSQSNAIIAPEQYRQEQQRGKQATQPSHNSANKPGNNISKPSWCKQGCETTHREPTFKTRVMANKPIRGTPAAPKPACTGLLDLRRRVKEAKQAKQTELSNRQSPTGSVNNTANQQQVAPQVHQESNESENDWMICKALCLSAISVFGVGWTNRPFYFPDAPNKCPTKSPWLLRCLT